MSIAFLKLFFGNKTILTILVIISMGGFSFYQNIQLTKIKAENERVVASEKIATTQRDIAIEAANTNKRALDLVLSERKNVDIAFQALQNEQKKIKEIISTLDDIITNDENNPANISSAQPVIKNILETIQEERKKRRLPK